MGDPPRSAVYRAERVRSAIGEFRSVLGPRAALVVGARAAGGVEQTGFLVRVVPPPVPPGPTRAALDAPADPRTVVGAAGAVPLLSGSLTGVLLAHALPERDVRQPGDATDRGAEVVLAEVGRLLQPGGFLLLLARIAANDSDDPPPVPVRSLSEIARLLRGAGLEPGRRVACHVTPSRTAERAARLPRLLWGIAAAIERIALRLGLARPVEITGLLAARKAGGLDVEYPGPGRIMGGMLLPPRWLERGRRRAGG